MNLNEYMFGMPQSKPVNEITSYIHNQMDMKDSYERKFFVIDQDSIHYIGKESNELDESTIMGVNGDSYTIYENITAIYQKILEMNEEDAVKIGISTRTLYYWKAKITDGKKIELVDKFMAKMG